MASIRWSPHPSTIGRELARRAAAIEPACKDLAASHASRGESAMKQTGLYQDRTTHLRGSTFGEPEGTTITLGAGMEYAPFVILGTSRMAARDFITPVAEVTASEYFADALKVVKGILG